MGIMVYSLLWVMQDYVHQPYPRSALRRVLRLWHRNVFLSSEPGAPEKHGRYTLRFRV